MTIRTLPLWTLFLLASCSETDFEPAHLASSIDTRRCITSGSKYANEHCVGKSVDVVGMAGPDGEVALLPHPSSGESTFIVEDGGYMVGKVRVRGVVQDAGAFSLKTVIKVHSIEAEPMTAAETAAENAPSAEEQIAENRRLGAVALDEADAAIRANNVDMKERLAAVAVSHHVSDQGGSSRVDVYGMADGRHIACTTKIDPSGPPITTCDGEP